MSVHVSPLQSHGAAAQPWDQGQHKLLVGYLNPFSRILPRLVLLYRPMHRATLTPLRLDHRSVHPMSMLRYRCMTEHPRNGAAGPSVGLASPSPARAQAAWGESGHILPMVGIGSSQRLVRARLRFSASCHFRAPFIGQSQVLSQAPL